MTAETIRLITLQTDQLDAAHRLSQQENWPHRREDWAFTHSLSHSFGITRGDRLVGTANMTPFGATSATANMIIVDPSMRGQSLGRRLMDAVLDAAGDRECRLVATESGRPLYEKLGFQATGTVFQCQGVAAAVSPSPATRPATRDDFDAIAKLDLCALGMDRRSLLSALFDGAETHAIIVLHSPEGLMGYASSRAFGRGALIGPVIARDDASALALFRSLIAPFAGKFIRADLTSDGAKFAQVLEPAGLRQVDTGTQMRRGGDIAPAPISARVYALASQALG